MGGNGGVTVPPVVLLEEPAAGSFPKPHVDLVLFGTGLFDERFAVDSSPSFLEIT
jgi:hypothetical protein